MNGSKCESLTSVSPIDILNFSCEPDCSVGLDSTIWIRRVTFNEPVELSDLDDSTS